MMAMLRIGWYLRNYSSNAEILLPPPPAGLLHRQQVSEERIFTLTHCLLPFGSLSRILRAMSKKS
jgi:hypothetical protein